MVDRGCFKQQEIQFLDEKITIKALVKSKKLPESFAPDNWSVICGRGKECYNHIGNRRLRVLVESNLPKYSATKSKFEKTIIVSSIVDAVRGASSTGGFVKQNTKTKQWVEVGDSVAREKIGQLLREAMMRKNPEKLNARKDKRRAQALKNKSKIQQPTQLSSAKSVSDCSTSSEEQQSDNSSCCGTSSSGSSVASSESDSVMPAPMPALTAKQIEFSRVADLFDADPLPIDMDHAFANPSVFAFPDLSF
ncbi:Nitrilase family, member 2 [Seminavis robusta]|uniref:Nitrilase family, member 2 n=1 Tax=Seminavis robusta TaxID=568900 RepID=A0A9N8E505_9STRA|nr:Nitrilase family, member 2 [Seminavis robusta]|eukprot:Sro675_g185560.1 Nitrilase family, member 2 (250) ;mRNA; r:47562-48311